jgi:hypothetical protein
LASAKLNDSRPPARHELILILFDADKECPRDIGPSTTALATTARKDKNIACVVANVEFETWFVAGAESLVEFLDLSRDADPPSDPETARHGKGWVEKRFKGVKYSETVDQPKLTAKLDLQLTRRRSPSFDKLCREVERFTSPDDAEIRS